MTSAMAMPSRSYVTAVANKSRRGTYSALDDRRTVKIVCVRTTAYENVLSTKWTNDAFE